MAKVTNPEVPTDLQALFNQLAGLVNIESSEQKIAKLLPSVRTAQPDTSVAKELPTMAHAGATWLTQAWVGKETKAEQSAFYAGRFNEIMTHQLQAPYWNQLAQISDQVGLAYPNVRDFSGDVNPAYTDPLRQPTDCRYKVYSQAYPTPSYPSSGTNPSPGWHGEVQDGYFVDLWHATRILGFTVPPNQRSTTHRPIILKLTIAIEATATIRGTPIWFTPITSVTMHNSGYTVIHDLIVPAHYAQNWGFTGTLPGDSPGGWAHEEEIEVWHYGAWKADDPWVPADTIVIAIATPPSMGRYYARNDSVTVTHNETVTVYLPLGPEEG